MEFFGDIERFLSDLYPYRWWVAGLLSLVLIAAVALSIKLGVVRTLARRPRATAIVAVPVTALLLVGGWYTLSPLWERSYLDEASPLQAAAAPTAAPTTFSSPGPASAVPTVVPVEMLPRQTHTGMFAGADDFHFGRGTAQLIETEAGVYSLRFEDFSVRNGPDLFVYLTPDPSGESIDGAINLGELKATDGAFNYEVPPGTDVSRYASAIVWCRQFSTLFAVAELSEI